MKILNVKNVLLQGSLCALLSASPGLPGCTGKEEGEAASKTETKVQDAAPRKAHKEVGEASWYGPGFHGCKTASGEVFDQREMTAAHPELPLGTEVEVTNLENKKKVEVEINDRGPYAKDRVIDLSKAAAKKLGMKEQGVSTVKIETAEPVEKKIRRPRLRVKPGKSGPASHRRRYPRRGRRCPVSGKSGIHRETLA
ncbi:MULTISPECIES: septal ring lytic transglycosylase RlpA family protein [Methylomicrobium]|uniref:Endolytic peptidoglycan transglycosylase RlpA n=1 Tax=Methylomicrobium album BG8 TaxID=686340 RepID=H8GPP3_METAL|nr:MULTISPECIES: septal ring lytic transglycosylase RlpA family protein [Methylomicrobium]EIC28505.1 rare lipoprotein A [Methylomicrobium album BG8]